MDEERERFFSRLASIEGVRTEPSINDWILLRVDYPQDLARKINRKLDLSESAVRVPRSLPGTEKIRIKVRDPKSNQELFEVLRDLMQKKARHRFRQELHEESIKN